MIHMSNYTEPEEQHLKYFSLSHNLYSLYTYHYSTKEGLKKPSQNFNFIDTSNYPELLKSLLAVYFQRCIASFFVY